LSPSPRIRAFVASAIRPALTLIVSLELSGPLAERGTLVAISKSVASSIHDTPLEWAPSSNSGSWWKSILVQYHIRGSRIAMGYYHCGFLNLARPRGHFMLGEIIGVPGRSKFVHA
jgi:hypothetical protein